MNTKRIKAVAMATTALSEARNLTRQEAEEISEYCLGIVYELPTDKELSKESVRKEEIEYILDKSKTMRSSEPFCLSGFIIAYIKKFEIEQRKAERQNQ